MRGTTYAISEIIWWMVAALAVGILIGWLLRRWFGGEAKLKDVQAELEARNTRYAELSTELGESKLQVESLNRDLESRAGALTEATDRMGELESTVSSGREELEVAKARIGELDVGLAAAQDNLDNATARAGELESSVAARDARITELESEAAGLRSDLKATAAELVEVRTSHADCVVIAESNSGRIAGLETLIAERDQRIADLEEQAAPVTAPPLATDIAAVAARSADLEALAAAEEESDMVASVPLTRFGTAGADHTDDLKVINGIGPKMEELLNGFGIRAWDQLAALSPDEVTRVDEALEEFPGRIERDRWVEQAKDLIRRFPDPGDRPDRESYLNESPS